MQTVVRGTVGFCVILVVPSLVVPDCCVVTGTVGLTPIVMGTQWVVVGNTVGFAVVVALGVVGLGVVGVGVVLANLPKNNKQETQGLERSGVAIAGYIMYSSFFQRL